MIIHINGKPYARETRSRIHLAPCPIMDAPGRRASIVYRDITHSHIIVRERVHNGRALRWRWAAYRLRPGFDYPSLLAHYPTLRDAARALSPNLGMVPWLGAGEPDA